MPVYSTDYFCYIGRRSNLCYISALENLPTQQKNPYTGIREILPINQK
jgi:hypothetical protein